MKALVVGINKYPGKSKLHYSINDAEKFKEVIEKNGNGSPNFHVKIKTDIPTKGELMALLVEHFKGHGDSALFYFSGHGYQNELGVHLVTPDGTMYDPGISMNDLLVLVNGSQITNRIIILDCCKSGWAGASHFTNGTTAVINKGVTILASSLDDENSIEVNGHSLFTNLLLEGLKGGASDIAGNITPGNLYAYIDQALGPLQQRPVFKTNVNSFISLRKIPPLVPLEMLRMLKEYFPDPRKDFPLDPSFEDSNSPDAPPLLIKPYAVQDNVKVFKHLQKFQSVGLVVPVDTPFMYFAAMESKACRLTPLGLHYWRLSQNDLIK